MASPRHAAHTAQGRQGLRLSLLSAAVAALLITATGAQAQTGASAPRQFDIPASSMVEALDRFGEQSGLQVSYGAELLEALRSKPAPAVNGQLSPDAALARLLQGSGLESGYVNAKTVVIKKASTKPAERTKPKLRAEPAAQEEEVTNMPAIMVTGTRSLNVDIERTRDDIQPYVVFNREKIEQSGAINLEDFLKKNLTMSASARTSSQSPGNSLGNTSSINLRGLGEDETLILIDGRRVAGVSFGGDMRQPDINGIPLSAVERIEVLPATASSIYGGAATGGAINIILRRDYSGIEASLSYGNTFDTDVANRRLDINAGWNFNEGNTSILVAGSVSDANRLLVRDRNLTRRARLHILKHNPEFFYGASSRPPLGETTNIRSVSGENLTLRDGTQLPSHITWTPYGYKGVAGDGGAALVENAGEYNLNLPKTAQNLNGVAGERQSLLNDPNISSLILTMRHKVTKSIEIFLDLNASKNKGYSQRSAFNISNVLIPAESAANPFTQSIRVTAPVVGLEQGTVATAKTQRAVGGLIMSLPARWTAAAEFAWDRSQFSVDASVGADNAKLSEAIGNGDLEILRDINEFPVDFTPYLGAPNSRFDSEVVQKSSALRLSGPLGWSLPKGKPILTALLEHRDVFADAIKAQSGESNLLYPSRSQDVQSIYLESVLPLGSARSTKLIELQLAIRHDRYSINTAETLDLDNPTPVQRYRVRSSSTDPMIGLRWQPFDGVMLRASYGTGYRPPSLVELLPGQPRPDFPLGLFGVTDPLRGGEPIGAVTLFSNSNDLRPEQSESWSIGLVSTPEWISGGRLSIDWVRTRKTDNITSIATYSQSDLENESTVPGLIVRGPVAPNDPYGVGPVIGLNDGLFNIALLDAQAIDITGDFTFNTQAMGAFDFSLSATRLLSLKTKLTPESSEIDNAGVSGALNFGRDDGGLKWKGVATVTWQYKNLIVGWQSNYFHKYYLNVEHSVVNNQGAAVVPSQTYHDMFARYKFAESDYKGLMGILSGAEVKFGVNNIFNRRPPVDVVSSSGQLGYSPWGDPRLANYYLTFSKQFGASH